MVKLHIYDMDGTILDSMRMWDSVCEDYLSSKGVKAEENISEICDPMTFDEVIEYMASRYDIGGVDSVYEEIDRFVTEKYRTELGLFDGIEDELRALSDGGVPMVILSNSPRALVLTAMERTGVLGYFDEVYTTEDCGMTKDNPEIFRRLCAARGVKPADALVHDDSKYALDAAAAAGCQLKVYDKYR